MGDWLREATDPSSVGGGQGAVLGTRFSASGIPDTTGHRGRAENRMGAPGAAQSALVPKGGESRGRGRCWMVPTQVRVLGLVHGRNAGRPSRGRVRRASLGESLSHHSSMAGLDEQRQSMVLELYCRKAERKREGRKRETTSHGHVERWGKGEREGGLESKKGESLKRARRGQAAPLIVGWAIR